MYTVSFAEAFPAACLPLALTASSAHDAILRSSIIANNLAITDSSQFGTNCDASVVPHVRFQADLYTAVIRPTDRLSGNARQAMQLNTVQALFHKLTTIDR